MREKRNGLRPITVIINKVEVKGYFHCFVQDGSLEEGIAPYAIIEEEDGKVNQVFVDKLKFDDIE